MFLYQAVVFAGSAANEATSSRGRLISISVRTSTLMREVCPACPTPFLVASRQGARPEP
jgi:hypothetical protein